MNYDNLRKGIRYVRDATVLLTATAVLSGCLSQTASLRGTKYTTLTEGNPGVVPISLQGSREQLEVAASNMYNIGAAQEDEDQTKPLFVRATGHQKLENTISTLAGGAGVATDIYLLSLGLKNNKSNNVSTNNNPINPTGGANGSTNIHRSGPYAQ